MIKVQINCMGQKVSVIEINCENCNNVKIRDMVIHKCTEWALKNGYSPRDMSYVILK